MIPLLIATTNRAKADEYRRLLSDFPFNLVSLRETSVTVHPEETGTTFAHNALIKARHYFEQTGLPTLADDGGFEVDALGGAPGVLSHRWLGEDASDEALVAALLERMKGVEPPNRFARLRAALALVYKDRRGNRRERVFEAELCGVVPERPRGRLQPGFPYRTVLYLPEYGCCLSELAPETAAKVSQRRSLVQQAAPILMEIAETALASDALD